MCKDRLKKGDKVIIDGALTGYGYLTGYITDIVLASKKILISVDYDVESKIIANGETGIVGYSHFFTKFNTLTI